MQTLEELNLPYLPGEDPRFGEDPMRYFAAAREQHPWLARTDIGLFVHQFSAIRELLGQDDKLRPAYAGIVDLLGVHGTPWGRFTQEQMISLPTEQHELLRHVLIFTES